MLDELRQWPQWVVHGHDKIPLRVTDGQRASSTNPGDWATFDAAYSLVSQFPQYGLGFVLSANDPFTCIDLDDPKKDPKLTPEQIARIYSNHTQIYNAFNTYAEYSPSGSGCHIWCVGNVEARKFTEGKIEVYSTGRYMTVTLKPLRNAPFTNCQYHLDELIAAIDKVKPRNNGNGHHTLDLPEALTDTQIFERLLQSQFGDKFRRLMTGDWRTDYQDKANATNTASSEADLALLNYLAFYTDNQKQVKRMFMQSGLYNMRDKYKKRDNLLDDMIKKSFDLKLSPEDRAQIKNLQITSIQKLQEIENVQAKPNYDETINWQKPDGLLGEIANFIYQAAIYPSHEVALSAAIAFMAGISGRAFNTSTNTGLNQYIVLLADTAQGKEGAARGISKLVKAVKAVAPPIVDFIGPSDIASAQGLLKRLAKQPCFMSQRGEIGFYLQKLNSKWAKANETNLKGMLLDLFNKSGHDDVLQGSAYSDQSKDAPSVHSPAFTLFGDSTPEEFYKAIDENNIAEGLISRLTVLSCPQIKPKFNDGASSMTVSPDLADKLANLVRKVCQTNDVNGVQIVQEDAEANAFQIAYREECLSRVWANRQEPSVKIWHRAHVRLLKLGALIAVGKNIDYPVVTLRDYQWAAKLIDVGVNAVVKRFNAGEVGIIENYWNEQLKCVGELFNKYLKGELKNPTRATHEMVSQKALTRSDIQNATAAYACFRKDNKASFALNNVLKTMIDNGIIIEVDVVQTIAWGKQGKCYQVIREYQGV